VKLLKNNAQRAKDHLFASQATYYAEPVTLTGGEGTRVRDDAGNEYLDAFGGIATNTLGYGDTEVAQAVAEQAKKLVHVDGFTKQSLEEKPETEAAQRGMQRSPDCQDGAHFIFVLLYIQARKRGLRLPN